MAKYFVEVNDGGTFWYKDEEMTVRHRDGGPAIEFANGQKVWYKDGKNHREDGPAIEWANGDKYWCIDGKIHREDGPAIEHPDGTVDYWLNNKRVTKEQWEVATRPVEELTIGDIEKLLGKRVKIVKE